MAMACSGVRLKRDLERRPGNCLFGGHGSPQLQPNALRIAVDVNRVVAADRERDDSGSFWGWHKGVQWSGYITAK